jgi:chemotaxis protein MotB
MPSPGQSGKTTVVKTVVRVHESRLKKKKQEEGEGGGERWLLTYADMITLLLALFIILFAISTPNKVKYAQLARAMSGGFGGTNAINVPTKGSVGSTQTTSTSPTVSPKKAKSAASSQTAQPAKPTPLTKKSEKTVKEIIKKSRMDRKVHVHMDSRGLVISLLSDSANYSSGSAEIRPQTLALLRKISGFLSHISNDIRVEGFTDNIPIGTAEYPSNWELSSDRAVVVARFLVEQERIDGRRLSAAGYGEYKPSVPNDTEAHRQLNRRVDIVVMNTRPP